MNPATRLAEIVTALERVSISCLVMGGHAVRYYGLDRNTADFDLHLSPDSWSDLVERLTESGLFADQPPREGPSWRPAAFRRFQVGRLPDGREEWLEFWRENHLLAPFGELYARREQGIYGGRALAFLSLPDLIRSKETERAIDWQDVSALEEFLDARLVAGVSAGSTELAVALAQLRSRRGFERHLQLGHMNRRAAVERALDRAGLSITQAYLLPFTPTKTDLPQSTVPIEPVVLNRLRTVTAGSTLHLALVEVVRRQYKLAAQAADRANKQAIRSGK